MKRNVLAMSFAPKDNHEAQVQFALERGVPATIGVLGTIRLPYPSSAFDMAQCSRCLIPWTSNGMLSNSSFFSTEIDVSICLIIACCSTERELEENLKSLDEVNFDLYVS